MSVYWLLPLLSPALLLLLAARSSMPTSRLRSWAVWAAAVMSVASFVTVFFGGAGISASATYESIADLAPPYRTLFPIPAALWLVTVAVTPRSRLDRLALTRTGLATLTTMLAFLTTNLYAIIALWALSTGLFRNAMSHPAPTPARRAVSSYLGVSLLLLLIGGFALGFPGLGVSSELAVWLLIAGVLIRQGIVPFHAWIPEVYERGPLGPAILFCAPQLGAYVTLVAILPHATPTMVNVILVLSLFSAVYGAAMSTTQRDARRACGYLFVSQSALLMAGLSSGTIEGVSGALVCWISTAVAFTGLGRCVLVLETRRGRLNLNEYHGGYRQMPLLAASFLLFGLCCTGFPGTLGFAGQELVIGGAVSAQPILGFIAIMASAITGWSVLRMYYSLFCGARIESTPSPMLRREGLVFGALAAFLVCAGLAPGAIVAASAAEANTTLPVKSQSGH